MSATPPVPSLAGLVLAGGRSSRFGAEKAVQTLGGQTLLQRALGALDGVCATSAVSAADGGAAALARRLGRTVLADETGHPSGPLAGLAVGLAWAASQGFERLVSLPCDTPLVDAAVLARLAGAGGAAYAASSGGPHPLVAVWPTSAAPALRARLAAGEHPSVRAFLAELGAQAVWFEDDATFRNANTAGELAAIAVQVSGSSSSSASQTDPDTGTSATS